MTGLPRWRRGTCPGCGREVGIYLPTVPIGGVNYFTREHRVQGQRCPGSVKIVEPLPVVTP